MELFRKSPLVFIAIAVCNGIVVGKIFNVPLTMLSVLAILAFLLFVYSHYTTSEIAFLITIFILSLGYFELEENRLTRLRETLDSLHDQPVHYSGSVLNIQQTKKGQKIHLKNINLASEISFDNSFTYHVYLRGIHSILIGDTLSGQGEWMALSGRRNPGDFDFRSFYHRQNIFGKIFQDKYAIPSIDTLSEISIMRTMAQIRKDLNQTFHHYVGKPYAGLLSALITGERNDVDPEIKDHFIATGVVHVLAVSGLHVGYVLLVLIFITKILRIPWGWDRAVIWIGLLLFCLLTGGKASVIRACLMAGLYMLAPVINRPANIWNIIAAAALCLLLWDPLYLFNMGFQLSFTAVISIVFFYNYLNRVLPEFLQVPKMKNPVAKFFWGLFLVSFSAQIGTLPFTAIYFGKIPMIALIANIIIVPLIGVLVGIGFVISLFSWIPFVGEVYGQAAWFFGTIIDNLAAYFAGFKYGIIKTGSMPIYLVCVYVCSIIGTFLFMEKAFRKKGIIALLIGLNVAVWTPTFQHPAMDVIFLDVGQGDAALVRFQNGKTMLIDAGQRNRYQDSGTEMILPVLDYFNINKLDWIVMSHPHSDHIGGLISVLESIQVDSIWDTHMDYHSWTYKRILELAEENNTGIRKLISGEINRIDGNTAVEVFAPDTVFIKHESNVNNASIVMKLIHGENSFLFTGDLEHEGDAFLLSFGSVLKTDVLKVGHHGSITSTTQAFLNLAKPTWAVVSVGNKNKFNHPSPIVMERLSEKVSNIRRTDLHQAVWFKSDGEKIWEVDWR